MILFFIVYIKTFTYLCIKIENNTDMKNKSGYKRKLIKTVVSSWTGKIYRTWEYTWADGTKDIKITTT